MKNTKLKVAYFGIDLLFPCLEELHISGAEILKIFTMQGDDYDKVDRVTAFAKKHNISLQKTRATRHDINELKAMGVELTVTAGYAWLIPVSSSIRQINVHPAFLPTGRGPWPMPVNILRNINSGVTLHILADRFDEGDILLREEILLSSTENLETLTERINYVARKLLSKFLSSPDLYFETAQKQLGGEYWPEPDDCERTITPETDIKTADKICRAFFGYGVIYKTENQSLEITCAEAVHATTKPNEKSFPIFDGFLIEI